MEVRTKKAMGDSPLRRFIQHPELLRSIENSEFFSICAQAVEEMDFMFIKGLARESSDDAFSGINRNELFVEVIEGEKKGLFMIVPDFPLKLKIFGRVLAEEHLTRTFSALSDSILADMMIRHSIYSSLWESFGEYAVFENQLRVRMNRKFTTLDPEEEKANAIGRREVEQFRSEFGMMIARGQIEPLSSGDIIRRGIDLFGKRYDCNFSPPINGLAHRFGSKIVFTTNSTMTEDIPYQFALGYAEIEIERYASKAGRKGEEEDFEVPVVMMTHMVAVSPALAPDMMGWTPS
jgi:hypothetical protein